MKKTLIAIAALAATGAFAQSTVAIDGVVDAGYVSYDMKGQKVTGADRNLSTTSQLNFRVTQDLGGGLKANWRSETDFVVTSNLANQGAATSSTGLSTGISSSNSVGSFMNGEQLLGLGGGFGRIEFGALNNAALFAHLYSQPFGTAIGSAFTAGSGSAATAAVRLDNSYRYTTPSFFGGLTAALLLRNKQSASTNANGVFASNSLGSTTWGSATDFNVNYNAGPLNATFVSAVNDATALTTPGNKGTFTALTGNYNMGALTVYAGMQNNKVDNAAAVTTAQRSQWNLAGQYDMGANRFMANYGAAKDKIATTNNTSKVFALGYEYALSKTTSAVARYESIKDDAGFAGLPNGLAAVAGNTTRTRMGVGLRMGF